MSLSVDLALLWPAAAGILVSVLVQQRLSSRKRFHADIQRIEWATQSMKKHAEALDAFMAVDEAPRILKTFLLNASNALESHDFTQFLATKLHASETMDQHVEIPDSDVWLAVQAISGQNTAVYDLFVEALFSGITAALLRWPETAPVLSAPIVPTQDYIKREVVLTDRAVRHTAGDRSPQNGMIAA
jgi:hypothetical protein